MVVSGKGEAPPHKCSVLQIKQDDKFFCRLLSKESSMSHPSFRVAAVAVPFVWESQPGTPKYTIFSEDSTLPPLTPPPSYYFNNNNNKKKPLKKLGSRSNKNTNNLLLALFPKLMSLKKSINLLSSSSHSSSSSSSSSSSTLSFSSQSNNSSFLSSWDSSSKVNNVPMGRLGRWRFLSYGSSFDFRGENDEEEEGASATSPTSILCFGIHRSTSSKGNTNNTGGSCRR